MWDRYGIDLGGGSPYGFSYAIVCSHAYLKNCQYFIRTVGSLNLFFCVTGTRGSFIVKNLKTPESRVLCFFKNQNRRLATKSNTHQGVVAAMSGVR